MKVKDICTRTVRSCTPETTLADAAWAMWEADCGALPILDETGKVVGVITDRDISIGAATKYRPAAQIAVREVISTKIHSCKLGDDVREALKTMRQDQVRRLPVVDQEGKLQGILSLNDIALAAVPDKSAKPGDVTSEDLHQVMKAVCTHREAPKDVLAKGTSPGLSLAKAG
jgi:CBS domain-containing protein